MNIGPDELDETSSIEDVLVDGVFLDDADQGIRMLTTGSGRLDRVTVRNVSGTYRSFGFFLNPWFPKATYGNFGNIFFENIDLRQTAPKLPVPAAHTCEYWRQRRMHDLQEHPPSQPVRQPHAV